MKMHTPESREATRARVRCRLNQEIAAACEKVLEAQRKAEEAQDRVKDARWDAHKARMTLRRYDDLIARDSASQLPSTDGGAPHG